MNVKPPLKCQSISDVLLDLNIDFELPYFSIDVREISQPNEPILHQKEFYKRLAIVENIIYVDVLVSDAELIEDNIVLYQLNNLKNLIVQCRSHSQGAKVYVKEFGKPSLVIDLRNQSTDKFDEATFITHLIDKHTFGLSLLLKALKSNHIGNFKKDQSLSTAVIDVNKEFKGERLVDYAVKHNNFLVVRFLSLFGGDLLKPNSVTKVSPLESSITYADRDVLAALLQLHFPIASDRIEIPKQTLTQFKNLRNQLFIAAGENNKQDILTFLVQCTDDKDIKNLITQLMKEKRYSIVLALLKADAVYPNRFSLKTIDNSVSGSKELKAFVNERDELHEFISDGDLDQVKMRLNTGSKYYLNSDNESAAATAYNGAKVEIYAFLWSKGITIRDEDEKVAKLKVAQQDELQNKLIEYFKDIGESCIPYLMSKSRLPQSQLDINRHKQIKCYYQKLSKIKEIAAVFAVLKYADYLDIVFDFESPTTESVAPLNPSCQGIYYHEFGRIYIGAGIEESELLGTIAHEFTHMAAELLYNNNSKPYSNVDKENEAKFKDIMDHVKAFILSSPCDRIISSVFTSYGSADWPAELIVRVNEMLGKHGSDEGHRLLEAQANQLLEYYSEKMRADCLKYVSESHLIKPRNTIRLLNHFSGVINSIEETNIQFKIPIDLTEHLSNSNEPFLCVSASNARLSTISVHQSLTANLSLFGTFLVFNYDRYRMKEKDIILAFRTEACKVLVLEFDSNSGNDLEEVKKKLIDNLPYATDKKVIFVTVIGSQELMDMGFKTVEMRKISLIDLTTDSQSRFLQKHVNFQGKEITFEKLIDKDSFHIVGAEILAKVLISKETLTIGKHPPVSSGYDERLYVLRKLIYSTKIIGVVNRFDETDISDSSSIIIESCRDNLDKMEILKVDATEMDFKNLCDNCPEKNIHWLKKKTNGFHWWRSRSSKASFDILKDYLDLSFSQVYDEDSFVDSVDELRMVIVSDTSGMGKTTLLTHQALLIKEKHPHLWVIRINLNNHTKILEQEVKTKSLKEAELDKVLNFFVNKLLESKNETKIDTNFEKDLLMHSIMNNGNAVLLFDACDELKKDQRKVMIRIIKSLRQTKVKQMWLTTRPYVGEKLEGKFQLFCHSMVPFTRKVQIRFLQNFWGQNLVRKDRVEKYAKAMVERLSECIKDRERQLTGIPLQLVLVADNENFKLQCKAFHDSNEYEPTLSDKLDFISLYDSFVDSKLKIFHFDKIDSEDSTQQADSIIEYVYPELKRKHQSPAVLALFSTEEQSVFSNLDKVDIPHLFKYGLIIHEIDEKPQFIHRTFAEYFAADFILNILISGNLRVEYVDFLAGKILASYEWATIRAFIDRRLSDKKISIDKLVKTLKSSPDITKINTWNLLFNASLDVNENIYKLIFDTSKDDHDKNRLQNVDDLSAMGLFLLSIKTSCIKATEMWIDLGMDINCRSRSNWMSLYSSMTKTLKSDNWLKVAQDVLRGTEINGLHGTIYSLCGCAALHVGTLYNQKDIVEMLLGKGADVDVTDLSGLTPLHVAAWLGHMDILEMLIKNGANINAVHAGGDTPLCDAIFFHNYDVIKYLASLDGFNINDNHANGITPLHMAAVYSYEEILVFLHGKGAKINAEIDFSRVGVKERHKVIWNIVESYRVYRKIINSVTPIHLALFRHDSIAFDWLNKCGAEAPKAPLPAKHALTRELKNEKSAVTRLLMSHIYFGEHE